MTSLNLIGPTPVTEHKAKQGVSLVGKIAIFVAIGVFLCIGYLALFFVRVMGVEPTDGQNGHPAQLERVGLGFDRESIFIVNQNDFDLSSVRIELDPGIFGDTFSLTVPRLKKGYKGHIPMPLFKKPGGVSYWVTDSAPTSARLEATDASGRRYVGFVVIAQLP